MTAELLDELDAQITPSMGPGPKAGNDNESWRDLGLVMAPSMGPGPKAGNDSSWAPWNRSQFSHLQWGPARRPGMTPCWLTMQTPMRPFNGARPEGRE